MPTKKAPEVSVVDQMADDANPPQYPDGAPKLILWMDLYPRDRRAEFKRKFKQFQPLQQKLTAAKDSGVFDKEKDGDTSTELRDARMEASADMDEVLAFMDALMGMCAEDPVAYREWAKQASDDHLAEVFSVFMARSQPGEVSSSTS